MWCHCVVAEDRVKTIQCHWRARGKNELFISFVAVPIEKGSFIAPLDRVEQNLREVITVGMRGGMLQHLIARHECLQIIMN